MIEHNIFTARRTIVKLNRRRFLKYGGAMAAVVGASALGVSFMPRPSSRVQNRELTSFTGTETISTATVPLFDAHLHQVTSLSLSEKVKLLREAGLSGAILLGPPATDTNAVFAEEKQDSDLLFPFAWVSVNANTQVLDLERQLDGRTRLGIGELALRHRAGLDVPGNDYPADGPVALQIYDLAARRKIPVLVHVEHEYSSELERALDHNRSATIIWAHMGDAQPSLIRDMMRRHSNLYVDISSRNPYWKRGYSLQDQSLTGDDGSLKTDWKSVFEEFADRAMFGTDINKERYPDLNRLMNYYRSVMAQLTPQTAEMIASTNAKKLLHLI